jgi:hypothetical protein
MDITREEIITVKDAQKNQYGDLVVNGGIKISKKREALFPVFQMGAEVKLGYSSYMNKEYVANAEQTGVHHPNETKAEPEPEPKYEAKSIPDNKVRSMCLSYSKDLATNGVIPMARIGSLALQFEMYCNNELNAIQLDKNIEELLK